MAIGGLSGGGGATLESHQTQATTGTFVHTYTYGGGWPTWHDVDAETDRQAPQSVATGTGRVDALARRALASAVG